MKLLVATNLVKMDAQIEANDVALWIGHPKLYGYKFKKSFQFSFVQLGSYLKTFARLSSGKYSCS